MSLAAPVNGRIVTQNFFNRLIGGQLIGQLRPTAEFLVTPFPQVMKRIELLSFAWFWGERNKEWVSKQFEFHSVTKKVR